MTDPASKLWDSLEKITSLRFDAFGVAWDGSGFGKVCVGRPAEGILIFRESGTWRSKKGREFQFKNVFRWSLVNAKRVRLEHLRFGPDHPVELFDLTSDGADEWWSIQPHL